MVTLSGASLVFAVLSVCAGGFFCRCFDNYRMCILQRFPAAAAIWLLPHHRNNFIFFFFNQHLVSVSAGAGAMQSQY